MGLHQLRRRNSRHPAILGQDESRDAQLHPKRFAERLLVNMLLSAPTCELDAER